VSGLHHCYISVLYFEQAIWCWLHRCNAIGALQGVLGSLHHLSECLLADDAALICTSRLDMIIAARLFEEVIAEFGLTISILKTKLLVAGANLTIDDVAPLEVGGGSVEVVKEFKYLGSLIKACGGMTREITVIVELYRLPKFLVSSVVLCFWLMILVLRLSN